MNIETIYKKLIEECNGKISTDTRDITEGSLFFAWKGEYDDGNKYAEEALKLGCNYVVVDNSEFVLDDRYILVDNSMDTLGKLAHHHRMQFDIPVIGLTGSNGKTTTKELITSVLGTEKNVVSTYGNLNNHVGVPITLFQINKDTEIAVIEMGANHVGEIANLCKIAHPTYGIITNIGRAHLGLFGGFEGVVRAKTELYRYLEGVSGTSFVNGADILLLEKSDTLEKVTYLSKDSDNPVSSKETLPFVSFEWKNTVVETNLTGEYNLMNIAAAISIGNYFGLSEDNIINGISLYKPDNSRSEVVETENGNMIIKDFYNANRSSMELALDNIARIKTEKNKIVILGDMFELGEYELEEHRIIVEKAKEYNFDNTILVGNAFSVVDISADNIKKYKTTNEAITALQEMSVKNSIILLKASNGMNFKKLFNEVNL